MPTNHNVQYNIPRVRVQMAGRQNRLSDGNFIISPTMTEPVKFLFGNQDGVPLQLQSFEMRFVVWAYCSSGIQSLAMGQSEVVINKKILNDDPYANEVEMVLTEDETLKIANSSSGNRMHWSLFLINDEDQVFPMQVSSTGGRFGTIDVDMAAAMPIAELIRTPTS